MSKKLKKLLNRFKSEASTLLPEQIVSLTLFGSQARGDARRDSDIDILIVTKSNDWHFADKLGEIAYNILLETGQYISTKVISLSHYNYLRQIHAPFIDNVLKDGVSV